MFSLITNETCFTMKIVHTFSWTKGGRLRHIRELKSLEQFVVPKAA